MHNAVHTRTKFFSFGLLWNCINSSDELWVNIKGAWHQGLKQSTCWWWRYSGSVSHCLLMMRRRMQAAMLRMTVNMVTMVGSTMSCSASSASPAPVRWSAMGQNIVANSRLMSCKFSRVANVFFQCLESITEWKCKSYGGALYNAKREKNILLLC